MAHELTVGGRSYRIWRLDAVEAGDVAGLPYSLKILLENLLRRVDGVTVTEESVAELAAWDPTRASHQELAFAPGIGLVRVSELTIAGVRERVLSSYQL